jgi:hypothetical protein
MAAVRFTDQYKGKIVFTDLNKAVWSLVTEDGGITWIRSEIPALRERGEYMHIYLSRNAELLTLTNPFQGFNESFVLRYSN